MILVSVIHEKDSNGNKIESQQNLYADLLAGDILRESTLSCPEGHEDKAHIVLGIVENENKEKTVDIIEIKDYCCISFKRHLEQNLKKEMKF